MNTELPQTIPEANDQTGTIERRGIEYIPETARHSTPKSVGFVFFGAQMAYGSLAMGALPIAFGLNWLSSFNAILVGTLLGSLAVAAMALMGPGAGTNSTVTSSAFFGIRGRYVGSLITQVIDLGYFALVLWVSAPPIVQVGHILFGLPDTEAVTTATLLVIGIGVLALAIYGHATLVAAETFTAWANFLCMLLLVYFCLPHLSLAHPQPLVLPHWWASWMLAVMALIANAISYAPFAGDYARYLPSNSPRIAVFFWPLAGMVAGCIAACLCGELIALSVSDPNNTIGLMLGNVPHLLLLPLALIGLIGNVSNGGMVAYNGMLDLQAVFWRLTRVQSGMLFSAIGLIFGYIGLVAFNLTTSIGALCSIVVVLVTPWIVINVIGFLKAHFRLDARALQSFSGRENASKYWYHQGFNIPAVAAWLCAITVGMMFSGTALFTGPLAELADGVDLSFVSAAVTGAVVYLLLGQIIPAGVRPAHPR